MNRQKLGKKSFLKAVVTVAVVMMFIIPVSSTFEPENTFADTTIKIKPVMQIVKKGETFNASIYVIPGKTIMSVDVGVMSFDPSLIHANSVVEGDLFTSYETFTPGIINNTAGTITNIAGNATPPHATIHPGFFCYISFTAQDEIGTSFLDIEDAVVTNTSAGSIPVTVKNGSVTIVAWSSMLNFSETSGNNDYVVFGEIHDANDGEPPDIYDMPKAPAPMLPYIRAWFDDGMSGEYSKLSEDYRRYPDTEKVWDLYAKWESSSSNSTNVTISWNNNEFNNCEYSNITLMRYDPFDVEWDFAANMLTENKYTYIPRYFGVDWLTDQFQIITSDPILPVISDVIMTNSTPLDTDVPYGWENVSCNVTDNVLVNQVKLVVTNITATIEYEMAKAGGNMYSCVIMLIQPGNYTYHIWAEDLSGNNITSASDTFALPPNWDVDMDGRTYSKDLMAIIWMYGVYGTDYPDPSSFGWVREDIDNDGRVYSKDLMNVIWYYGDYWWT